MSGNKLWSKEGTNTSKLIETFTIGRDKEFDVLLAEYDVLGSLAHTEMLESVGLLSAEDRALIHQELKNILQEIRNGQFAIEKDIEDVHSQIEWMLTSRIGKQARRFIAEEAGTTRSPSISNYISVPRYWL